MFRSLRAKLIAAFAAVILLSLLLAGSTFVVLTREYQAQLALDQLADLALPLSYQVNVLEREGADAPQIARFLDEQATEMRVRLLLVDACMEAQDLVGRRKDDAGVHPPVGAP